ncbi:MAG: hypothetical protein II461_02700, partial [Treponema sp.]|nr:hypothetical protein [Treponema sp.]
MPLDVIEFPVADTVPSELNTTVMLIELKLKVPLYVPSKVVAACVPLLLDDELEESSPELGLEHAAKARVRAIAVNMAA